MVVYASNINIVRIGSRIPIQEPSRVNEKLLHAIRPRTGIRFELGTHVNHALELFPEVKKAFQRLSDIGISIYNQSVLLRNVNDSTSTLIELCDELRKIDIENHYLFHAIPLRGSKHHRTSLEKGFDLIQELTNSGVISGRCYPKYTVMTDIGKIVLNNSVILDRKKDQVLLQSSYLYEDRKKWNPNWQLPASAFVDENGYMRVWYLDGIN